MTSLRRIEWAALLLSAILSGRASAQADPTLRRVADRYWDALQEQYPMSATARGDYRYNDKLDDVSESSREKWKNTISALRREARDIDLKALSAEDRLTRELLVQTLGDDVLRNELGSYFMPLEPLDGPHIQFPLILVSHPFRDAADFRAYLSRLRAFPKYIDDHVRNMREGIARGMVPPKVVVWKTVPQIKTHIVRDVSQSEFHTPLAKANAIPEDDRLAIVDAIAKAIETDVVPTYLRLLAFVEDEYLPVCRETVGLGSLPNGEKLYENWAHLHTTTRIPPSEIHEIGLAEVARIRSEMSKIQTQVGFEGTLDAFLEHMRTDPKQRFGSREEIIAAADGFLQRTKPLMSKLFTRLPKTDCVMKEMEAFRSAASPVAYYNQPAEDGSRPGYYYINTYSPQDRLRFTLEALTYHESIPGHHFQIALHQENTELPMFRRYGGFTAFVEGWGLYTEKLGYEIGGYQDPFQRFGQLTFEMWRACRLVVDTGMHLKGWTRQQAIEFIAQNTSLAPLDIESEIDRYISWPGQALAYKIGELRILDIRKKAEQELGNRFDLRAFHDALLSEGAMPLDVLERRMDEWITSRAAAASP